jgi:uncharacterized membrane protein YgdD (TMEM256/DUF423 family)
MKGQRFRTSTAGRRIVAIGAISAGLSVAMGAFGAHALEARVSADMLANYETGARYHFFHSLGMIAVGLLALLRAPRAHDDGIGSGSSHGPSLGRLRWSAVFMLSGIVLFSGSLYTMALTGLRWLGAVTPLGGGAFLIAWALFAWAAIDGDDSAGSNS